jgi:hypothetical protein
MVACRGKARPRPGRGLICLKSLAVPRYSSRARTGTSFALTRWESPTDATRRQRPPFLPASAVQIALAFLHREPRSSTEASIRSARVTFAPSLPRGLPAPGWLAALGEF